jgi:hypothetical protein
MNNKSDQIRSPGKPLIVAALLAAACPMPTLAQLHVDQTISAGTTLTKNLPWQIFRTVTNEGTLTNSGTIDNPGTVNNSGLLDNRHVLNNASVLANSGTLDSHYVLVSTGTLTNEVGATLNNQGGGIP